jgi:hypothetical protein
VLGNTQPTLKRHLVLAFALCFAPLWAGLPTAAADETPIGGMRAPLVSMLEPDSRLTLQGQRLPKGVLPHVFRRGAVPTPAMRWYVMPRVHVTLPMTKLFVVFSRWSLEGG